MSCILSVVLNKISNGLKQILVTYGRVPFFFFIVHLAVISFSAWVWTYISFGKGIDLSFENPKNWPAGYQPSLARAYFVWLLLIIILYFPCRWYGEYKAKSKGWWVAYLWDVSLSSIVPRHRERCVISGILALSHVSFSIAHRPFQETMLDIRILLL